MTPLHTYRLEKYHGTASRHRCPHCNRPRCFTLYVDAQGRPLHPTVGRCDHESSCAYHYTPRQFFADHPTLRPASPKASPSHRHSVATGRPASCPTPQRLCTIPSHYMWRSESLNSHLLAYLATIYGRDAVAQAASIYRIGATRSQDTIFWQIDINGLVRTGKIMAYDPTTGHRLRNAHGVDWVHARLLHNGNLHSMPLRRASPGSRPALPTHRGPRGERKDRIHRLTRLPKPHLARYRRQKPVLASENAGARRPTSDAIPRHRRPRRLGITCSMPQRHLRLGADGRRPYCCFRRRPPRQNRHRRLALADAGRQH